MIATTNAQRSARLADLAARGLIVRGQWGGDGGHERVCLLAALSPEEAARAAGAARAAASDQIIDATLTAFERRLDTIERP